MTEDRSFRLRWSGRWSLTTRILVVNILALAFLAGSFAYLDSYRTRLIEARTERTAREVSLMAAAIAAAPAERRPELVQSFGAQYLRRIRLYDGDTLILDSFKLGPPSYTLRNPSQEAWQRKAARFLDRSFDRIVGGTRYPVFSEPLTDIAAAWPEITAARQAGQTEVFVHYAPDRTPMLVSATNLHTDITPDNPAISMLVTENARDITRTTRSERWRLALVLAGVTISSVLLSLFLARTIVQPLRILSQAAERVKSGRARDVIVPRLPARRDEIGHLARAVADMTSTLRTRIDASETFAADLTHELKNPLASLRSAVETLGKIDNPVFRDQLLDIIRQDAERLDRLITDIAEISRLDAELTRTRFELFDLGKLLDDMIRAWSARQDIRGVRFAYARQQQGTAMVMGDKDRLARMFHNLIDNAQSFSPPNGLVTIALASDDQLATVRITDEGPGIPRESREAIFRRFHSDRPDSSFGRHSGLGLAIARTIIEGHGGHIIVDDREDEQSGASFRVELPQVTQE